MLTKWDWVLLLFIQYNISFTTLRVIPGRTLFRRKYLQLFNVSLPQFAHYLHCFLLTNSCSLCAFVWKKFLLKHGLSTLFDNFSVWEYPTMCKGLEISDNHFECVPSGLSVWTCQQMYFSSFKCVQMSENVPMCVQNFPYVDSLAQSIFQNIKLCVRK